MPSPCVPYLVRLEVPCSAIFLHAIPLMLGLLLSTAGVLVVFGVMLCSLCRLRVCEEKVLCLMRHFFRREVLVV